MGAGIRWPFHQAGFWSDDYIHYAMLKDRFPTERSPFDLFDFSGRSETAVKELMDWGYLPWWTHPHLRLAMWRPLSSLLIAFDVFVLEFDPIACHIHSLFWWVFLISSVAILFRLLFPFWVSVLATFFFALEGANGSPLVWLANRNALLSLGWGFIGLWAYLHFRRDRRTRYAYLSFGSLVLALLSGEWAFPVFGYFIAFEILGTSDAISKRFVSLMPFLSLVLATVAVRFFLGYGIAFSGTYIDPFYDPAAFFVAFYYKLPAFIIEIIFSIDNYFDLLVKAFPPHFWNYPFVLRSANFAINAIFLSAGIAFLLWTRQKPIDSIQRKLGWLILGSFFALVPMASPPLFTRSVLPASMGISAAWSILLVFCCRSFRYQFSSNPGKAAFTSLLGILLISFFHMIVPIEQSIRETKLFIDYGVTVDNWVLKAEIDDHEVGHQDIVLVDNREHSVAHFLPFIRYLRGHALPKSYRVLNASSWPYDIKRTAANELMLTTLGGTLISSEIETFYNNQKVPFEAGESVSLGNIRVNILRLYKGKPSVVRFIFDRPLEDPSLVFLHSTASGLRRFIPPKIGEVRTMPLPPLPTPLRSLSKSGGEQL